MSFIRNGTPEPIQTIKFKCRQCNREALTLNGGLCSLCEAQAPVTKDLQDVEKAIKKTEDEKIDVVKCCICN